jgi:MmyB-like transcription regulator ligand binding domain
VATAGWRLVAANRPLLWLLLGLPNELLREPVNVLRLALHPDGLITRVRNPSAWRRHLHARLRRQARASADPELVELEREVRGYPAPDRHEVPYSDPNGLFASVRLHHHDLDLAFITTVATFGTPLDITPAELVIESLFPADPATARAMTDHAHLFPSSTWPA